MTSDADLLALSDENWLESQREHARFIPPYSIEERDGMILSSCALTFPAAPFNAVSLSGAPAPPPEQVVKEARDFFGARKRGFSVMIKGHRDHELAAYCEQQGFAHFGDAPGMLLRAPVAAPSLADGVEVRTVATEQDAAQFAEVAANAFVAVGLPVEVGLELLSKPDAWLQPHWHVRMIVENGTPVAGAMVLMSHGIAGIYWVATLEASRGKGYGEAITRIISNDAFERGAQAVVLQASQFGEPVYRRIGFEEITRYHWYMVA